MRDLRRFYCSTILIGSVAHLAGCQGAYSVGPTTSTDTPEQNLEVSDTERSVVVRGTAVQCQSGAAVRVRRMIWSLEGSSDWPLDVLGCQVAVSGTLADDFILTPDVLIASYPFSPVFAVEPTPFNAILIFDGTLPPAFQVDVEFHLIDTEWRILD